MAEDLFWRTPGFSFEMSSEPISEVERERAYQLFLEKHYPNVMFPPLIKKKSRRIESKLKIARQTLQLTTEKVAEKMQIHYSVYQKYEQGEIDGTISIGKLKAAAEAIGCEFVYEFRAKDGRELIRRIWEPAFEDTKSHEYLSKCVANRRPHALNKLIIDKLNDPKFRRKMGWSKKLFCSFLRDE